MDKFIVLALSLLLGFPAAMAQTSASIQSNPVVSRTGGVAPLMVFFDATGTTAPGITGRPFHELEYRWTFGDAAATWSRGSRPGLGNKNVATGPISAHVYERPGTYTATVKIHNGRISISRQIRITVSDPNSAFSGTRTVCFSTGARGFSGCPAAAQQVRTSNYASAINTHRGSGKRLLFRRGETFTATTPAVINVNGPGVIGAFGPSGDPLPVLRSSANSPNIRFSSNRTPAIRDWRVMDVQLIGNGTQASNGIALDGGISQLTLLRLNIQRQRVGIMADHNVIDWHNRTSSTSGHRIWDQLALVDSTISAVNHSSVVANKGYGVFMSADRMFFAGNSLDNAGTSTADVSHVARFPYLAKAVISNNTMQRPGPGDHVIKLHAPRWGAALTPNRGAGGGYSRWLLLSDNKIVGASNPWIVAIGPQNAQSDERVRDVIAERNWIVGGPGMQVGQVYFATDVTSRNNIVDSSQGASWQNGIHVARRGIEPAPTNIRIYNETFFTAKYLKAGQFAAIDLSSRVSNVAAWNNLAYAPNTTSPLMIRNACGACLAQSNNSGNTQIRYNHPFAVGKPASPSQFKAAGYAIGNGRSVPAWLDFFTRDLTTASRRDLGAVFH